MSAILRQRILLLSFADYFVAVTRHDRSNIQSLVSFQLDPAADDSDWPNTAALTPAFDAATKRYTKIAAWA